MKRSKLLVVLLVLLALGMGMTLNQNAAQYNPKRLLALSLVLNTGNVSLSLFDPQNRSIISLKEYELGSRDPIRWSPSGHYIVFSQIIDGSRDLFLFDTRDGSEIRITNDDASERCFNWSHDGQSLFYYSQDEGEARRTYRYDLATNEHVEIGQGVDIGCLAPSPDGERYVFSSNVVGNSRDTDSVKADIYVSDNRFENIERITSTNAISEIYPVWSPNGQFIAFDVLDVSIPDEPVTRLSVFDLERGTTKEISTGISSFVDFNWMDDGRLTYTNTKFNIDNQVYRIYLVDVVSDVQSFVDLPYDQGLASFDWSPPLDTLLPTPTATVPGPDLSLPLAPDCPNALPSRLGMFMIAAVPYAAEGEVRTTLRVRAAPGGEQVGSLQEGQRFRIGDQAECGADGLRWWPIQALEGGISGWSAESIGDSYLMEPIATR
jgi:hypothetical protein